MEYTFENTLKRSRNPKDLRDSMLRCDRGLLLRRLANSINNARRDAQRNGGSNRRYARDTKSKSHHSYSSNNELARVACTEHRLQTNREQQDICVFGNYAMVTRCCLMRGALMHSRIFGVATSKVRLVAARANKTAALVADTAVQSPAKMWIAFCSVLA